MDTTSHSDAPDPARSDPATPTSPDRATDDGAGPEQTGPEDVRSGQPEPEQTRAEDAGVADANARDANAEDASAEDVGAEDVRSEQGGPGRAGAGEAGSERATDNADGGPGRGRLLGRVFAQTAVRAWRGNLFSEAAEAAFWQTLSLPPLLLGLLGSLGYLGDWFGPKVVREVQDGILTFSRTVFSPNVVDQIISPTVSDILTKGKGEVVSIGFVISLWAGSSAMSSFVDAITLAHGQDEVRNEIWQRILALLLYLVGLVVSIVGLPVLALGPDLLPRILPDSWLPEAASWISGLYYPVIAVLLVLMLATLYKLALPHKLPWFRGLPGATLAMVVFVLSSIGLRLYIGWITSTGYTYGALATPIAFLLFAFFAGLAIVIGAYFNAAIQRTWPARTTRWWRHTRWLRLARGNTPNDG